MRNRTPPFIPVLFMRKEQLGVCVLANGKLTVTFREDSFITKDNIHHIFGRGTDYRVIREDPKTVFKVIEILSFSFVPLDGMEQLEDPR